MTGVIAYLADFTQQLKNLKTAQEKHGDETRLLVEESFGRINAATQLFNDVEKSAIQSTLLTDLIHRSGLVNNDHGRLSISAAVEEVKRVSDLLKSVGDGVEYFYEGEGGLPVDDDGCQAVPGRPLPSPFPVPSHHPS